MWKKTAAEKIAAREKETKKAQDRLNRKKEKEEMVKEQVKEQQEKDTEKAKKKIEEQRKKETERAQKKAQRQQHKGTAPNVPENTQQTGQNGGKPAEESSHLAQSNLQRGAGHPEHIPPSQSQLDGSRHDGSMTKGGNTPASTTDPTKDSGRHAQRHVHKGAGTPELTTPPQPQPGGSHHDESMTGSEYTSASATDPAEESSHLAHSKVQQQPEGSQHDGSMTEREDKPASTTDPAEDINQPAQNNLHKGDGNPEPLALLQPQSEGSQHDAATTGRGNTPATSTTDDTSRLPEDNVQNGAGNPEHTTPSQPQPECSQHDVSMTERGKTSCGATDDTPSCAPKELQDTNATADNEEDKGISQGHAADGGNDPPQSNIAEDEVKEAEKDKSLKELKELKEEYEKLKKELEMQKQVSVAPDNSPSDNTALEVRCAVVVESDGIRQTRSAREQFLKSVKTSLSSDGINLDTTNVTPSEEMDEDKAGRYTKPLLLIVPCLATARVESNITNAIDKITMRREHKKLLVVFHPRAAHDVHVPESRHQVSPEIIMRCEIIVDVIFDRVSGAIFPIQINRDAESRMNEYLHGCASPGATD